MTLSTINSQTPSKFIMVTYEFGSPVYIAALKDGEIQVSDNKSDAEVWDYIDTLTYTKLRFHKKVTGYKRLQWEGV